MSLRRVEDAGIMATFDGFFACYDRVMAEPVAVSPSSVGPLYPPHIGQRWTTYEDMRLVSLYASGIPYAEMARELGRPGAACQQRIRRMGYGCVK